MQIIDLLTQMEMLDISNEDVSVSILMIEKRLSYIKEDFIAGNNDLMNVVLLLCDALNLVSHYSKDESVDRSIVKVLEQIDKNEEVQKLKKVDKVDKLHVSEEIVSEETPLNESNFIAELTNLVLDKSSEYTIERVDDAESLKQLIQQERKILLKIKFDGVSGKIENSGLRPGFFSDSSYKPIEKNMPTYVLTAGYYAPLYSPKALEKWPSKSIRIFDGLILSKIKNRNVDVLFDDKKMKLRDLLNDGLIYIVRNADYEIQAAFILMIGDDNG